MCGIAGFYRKNGDGQGKSVSLERMLELIRHRGPDDEGSYYDGGLALGHCRLAIVDLSRQGRQPMSSAEGDYVISFNGEIYNYVELREELQAAGRVFRTKTDTEVILHAYREWGEDCVTRFNGMWAFVLYDKPAGKLFFSRDRAGIKPLYYGENDDWLLFASEIKAIVGVEDRFRKPDENFLYRFLDCGLFDDGEETAFSGVRQLMPAHNGVYDLKKKTLRLYPYWEVNPKAFYEKWIAGKDPYQTFDELLRSAVSVHLRADVPLGSCLSGGVDSSSIVALASGMLEEPMRTFSGVYRADADCDESAYIDQVNAAFHTIPYPTTPDPEGDLIEIMKHITWFQDVPTTGSGLYTQYYVMRRACGNVKVLLDGQGSDELFAGYLNYFQPYLKDLMASGKREDRKMAKAVARDMEQCWNMRVDVEALAPSPLRRAVQGVKRAAKNVIRTVLHVEVHMPDSNAPAFEKSYMKRVTPIRRTVPKMYDQELPQEMYADLIKKSIPTLLHYEDRNSMAYSIESRVPFLDYRIMEFALALPVEYKLHESWTKWILRKTMEGILPDGVTWRRSKLGYPTPFARWIRKEENRPLVSRMLSRFQERKILKGEYLNRIWAEHQSGKADHAWMLYRFLSTEIWYELYIDDFLPQKADRAA